MKTKKLKILGEAVLWLLVAIAFVAMAPAAEALVLAVIGG